jgi:hypothetical protein
LVLCYATAGVALCAQVARKFRVDAGANVAAEVMAGAAIVAHEQPMCLMNRGAGAAEDAAAMIASRRFRDVES